MNKLALELKSNQRLRVGLVLIVAIVWLYGVLELRDRTDAAAKGLEIQARQVFRLQQQSAQAGWIEAAKVSDARRAEVEKILWISETSGGATAAVQDWLQEQTRKSGIPQAQITFVEETDRGPFGAAVLADKAESLPPGITKVKGRLSFEFDGPSFNRFMVAATGGAHPIYIDSLTIHNLAPGRVDIQFFALARIGNDRKAASS